MRPCPPPLDTISTPKLALPRGACDAHCHVFGPAARFAFSDSRAYTPQDAPKERLFALHETLGLSRRVIVQASCHGTDNAALVDALRARPETSRGVAGLSMDANEDEIAALHEAGVRATRINFMSRITTPPTAAEIRPLVARIAPYGWHLVLHFDADQLGGLTDFILSLDIPVVVDHMARLSADDFGGPFCDSFLELMRHPTIWTKISGAERGSTAGPPFTDMLPIVHALAALAEDRLLWGTDWPHPVLTGPMPDDGALVDLLGQMLPDPLQRARVLVDNPARLYGFPPIN